jgi:hypothetical protein
MSGVSNRKQSVTDGLPTLVVTIVVPNSGTFYHPLSQGTGVSIVDEFNSSPSEVLTVCK